MLYMIQIPKNNFYNVLFTQMYNLLKLRQTKENQNGEIDRSHRVWGTEEIHYVSLC